MMRNFYAGFQRCYVTSNSVNLRLPDEISAQMCSENWDVKMEHLPNLVTHQQLYYKAKCWALSELRWPWTVSGQYEMVGRLVTEQLRLSVMRQVVTLLQLSYCAACSNNQHCLTLQTYFCTSVNTILLKCLTTIIAVTDGYTCFLSEPVWMSLQYPFVVRWGWRGLREDRGICSSVSTVRTVIAG